MKHLPLALILTAALALAGCTATNESADNANNTGGSGRQVQGTVEAVDDGSAPAMNETNTTANSTNETGSS